jgi:predicted RND superfamily exporter protein
LAIGIADTVHILSIFYNRLDEGAEKVTAIHFAIRKTAIAVLMTTLTTAAGLLSFSFAKVEPTKMMGIFGAIGTVFALFYTLVMVPSLLTLLPIKRITRENPNTFSARLMAMIDKLVLGMGNIGIHKPRIVIAVYFLIAAVSIAGMTQMKMSHDQIRWWPADHPSRIAAETLDEKVGGTLTLDFLVDGHQENALYNPKLLKLIEDIEATVLEHEYNDVKAKKFNSILNVIKQNHQALNENDPEYYSIPESRELIAQELLLFENSGADDLEDFANNTMSKTKMTMMMAGRDMLFVRDYLDQLRDKVAKLHADSGLNDVSIMLAGIMVFGVKTLYNMIYSCIESYVIAFSLVGILMFVLMGGIRKGILAFVPNIIPIFLTLGMMGWAGIPLNILTSLLGCVVIGISVDDTIHFMHHYQDKISQGSSSKDAVLNSLRMSGRAITFTSLVLIGCFIVYAFDIFRTAFQFGILLSFSIATALFANLMLAPALLQTFWKYVK